MRKQASKLEKMKIATAKAEETRAATRAADMQKDKDDERAKKESEAATTTKTKTMMENNTTSPPHGREKATPQTQPQIVELQNTDTAEYFPPESHTTLLSDRE